MTDDRLPPLWSFSKAGALCEAIAAAAKAAHSDAGLLRDGSIHDNSQPWRRAVDDAQSEPARPAGWLTPRFATAAIVLAVLSGIVITGLAA